MKLLIVGLAAVLLCAIAANTASAVDCGELGDVQYLSGCSACSPVNVTFAGRNGTKPGRRPSHPGGRGLLRKGRDERNGRDDRPDDSWLGSAGWKLLPNCTECDASQNFVMLTKPGNASRDAHPSMGRCGCKQGYGPQITANVTVTFNNHTKTIPTFECIACTANQVNFGPNAGVIPAFNKTSGTWTLVLKSTTNAKARKAGIQTPLTDPFKAGTASFGYGFGKHGGDKGRGKFGPYLPGQCVDCPTGSKSNGTACV